MCSSYTSCTCSEKRQADLELHCWAENQAAHPPGPQWEPGVSPQASEETASLWA